MLYDALTDDEFLKVLKNWNGKMEPSLAQAMKRIDKLLQERKELIEWYNSVPECF
jgi:hypothetical protein